MHNDFREITGSTFETLETQSHPICWPWTRISVASIPRYFTQRIATPDPQTLLKEVEEIRQHGQGAVTSLEAGITARLQVEERAATYTNQKVKGTRETTNGVVPFLVEICNPSSGADLS